MSKKVGIAVLVFLIGIGLGWYFFRGSTPPQPATVQGETQGVPPASPTTSQGAPATGSGTTEDHAAAAKIVVTYTDNGFDPGTTTVKKGTTVRFINKSSGPMWVASNPHPTHTALPGFDELGGAQGGETYEYTFTTVGSWGYHNHLAPGDIGKVIVTE
ncbi:hypothetical protein HY031_02100 [Candidatus Gottesmanbacteria bacterium]|nr:hypothetical protein [Candidatus Gottesmanbacteria bacterium]